MVDASRKGNLPEPEFNQNVAFVWVTFKCTTRRVKKGIKKTYPIRKQKKLADGIYFSYGFPPNNNLW